MLVNITGTISINDINPLIIDEVTSDLTLLCLISKTIHKNINTTTSGVNPNMIETIEVATPKTICIQIAIFASDT